MSSASLIEEFDAAMRGIYHRALSELGYRATIFLKMVRELGGLETAHRLINSPAISYGYTALCKFWRLDLTVEALIVENPRWHELFSPEELTICRNKLREYGYVSQKS